jgi:MOSC domain-containing protein YiiM
MSVERIFVSSASGGVQQDCEQAELRAGQGIVGDHNFGRSDHPGRNVTLVEAEEIESFCRDTSRPVDCSITRRNVVTRGVRLNELVGRRFRIGDAVLLGVELCEPCALLGRRLAHDALTPAQVVKRLLGRAGLRADVLESGTVGRGATLQTLPQ